VKIINNRYSIIHKLGQGGSSITYAGIDKETGDRVAIKALSLTGLEDWKKIELFEREAKILKQLSHPFIPKHLDYFQVESDNNVDFYIVKELAVGRSLNDLISKGWLPDIKTVKDIAERVLEILVYLQQLTPPVIHRDIKPQNIIYQTDTDKLFLVDFGAVRDAYHHTVMRSTVVGTYGYMAPEQFRGGAVLSTDLYGLGCTLLFLLTGKYPVDLPQKKLKIDFRNIVKVERNFANWIDKLIEPNIRLRFPKAEAALLVLQAKKPISDYEKEPIVKPQYSSIKIYETEEKLIIDIPPPFTRKRADRIYYFWLVWSLISILNRLAIFISVGWIGKLYIITWFYHVFFTKSKAIALGTQGISLLIFLMMMGVSYNFSIPTFSMYLILIDFIICLIAKHNFIQQLLVKTSICINKLDNKFYSTQKLIKSKTKQVFSYELEESMFPNTFLAISEQHWLRTEIYRYLQK